MHKSIENSQDFLQQILKLCECREQKKGNDSPLIQDALIIYLKRKSTYQVNLPGAMLATVTNSVSRYNQDRLDGLQYFIKHFMDYEILPESKSIQAAARWILFCVELDSALESSPTLYLSLDQALRANNSTTHTDEIKTSAIRDLPSINDDAKQLIVYCANVKNYNSQLDQLEKAKSLLSSGSIPQDFTAKEESIRKNLNTPFKSSQSVASSVVSTSSSDSKLPIAPISSYGKKLPPLPRPSSISSPPLPLSPPPSAPPLPSSPPPLPTHNRSSISSRQTSLIGPVVSSSSSSSSSSNSSSNPHPGGAVGRLTSRFENLSITPPSDLKNARRFSVQQYSPVSSSSSLFSSSSSSSSSPPNLSGSSRARGSMIALPGLIGVPLAPKPATRLLSSSRSAPSSSSSFSSAHGSISMTSSSSSSSSVLVNQKSSDRSQGLENEGKTDEFVKNFECPVNFEIFKNPVTLNCGTSHDVELGVAVALLKEEKPCPCCRGEFTSYQPNRTLQNIITDFLKIDAHAKKYQSNQHTPDEQELEILQRMKPSLSLVASSSSSSSSSSSPLSSSSSSSSSSMAGNFGSLFEQKTSGIKFLLPRLVIIPNQPVSSNFAVLCLTNGQSSDSEMRNFLLGIQGHINPMAEGLPLMMENFEHKIPGSNQKLSFTPVQSYYGGIFLSFIPNKNIILLFDVIPPVFRQSEYTGYTIKIENGNIKLDRVDSPYNNLPAQIEVGTNDILRLSNQLLEASVQRVPKPAPASSSWFSR